MTQLIIFKMRKNYQLGHRSFLRFYPMTQLIIVAGIRESHPPRGVGEPSAGRSGSHGERHGPVRTRETLLEQADYNSSGEAPPKWPNKPCHISPNPPRYIY